MLRSPQGSLHRLICKDDMVLVILSQEKCRARPTFDEKPIHRVERKMVPHDDAHWQATGTGFWPRHVSPEQRIHSFLRKIDLPKICMEIVMIRRATVLCPLPQQISLWS